MQGARPHFKSLQFNLNHLFWASGKRLGDRLTAEAVWKNDLASVSPLKSLLGMFCSRTLCSSPWWVLQEKKNSNKQELPISQKIKV